MDVTIEKQWDENVREHEAPNGRIYVSQGRWQWVVYADGHPLFAEDTAREARSRAVRLRSGEEKP